MASAYDHDASLRFSYPTERRARTIERAIRVEVGEIEDARSTATVIRDGSALEVRIRAADLVALRAGCNSWTRLIDVAENVCGSADAFASG